MQVNKTNSSEAFSEIERSLAKAEYVAVDLELTGVRIPREPDSYADTLAARLAKDCSIAEGHAIMQLGLTIVTPTANGKKDFATYNITVAPEDNFVWDDSAMQFLRHNGHDLNDWIDHGVPWKAREDFAGTKWKDNLLSALSQKSIPTSLVFTSSELRRQRSCGFDFNSYRDSAQTLKEGTTIEPQIEVPQQDSMDRLWQILRTSPKPVVVHGYRDILFLLAKFEQPRLPRDPSALAQLIRTCFPCYVYDTCYLHECIIGHNGEHKYAATRLGLKHFHEDVANRSHTTLPDAEVLEAYFKASAQKQTKDSKSNKIQRGTDVAQVATKANGKEHEAGYDSLMTALLFSNLTRNMKKNEAWSDCTYTWRHDWTFGQEQYANRLACYNCAEIFDVDGGYTDTWMHTWTFGHEQDVTLLVCIPGPLAYFRCVIEGTVNRSLPDGTRITGSKAVDYRKTPNGDKHTTDRHGAQSRELPDGTQKSLDRPRRGSVVQVLERQEGWIRDEQGWLPITRGDRVLFEEVQMGADARASASLAVGDDVPGTLEAIKTEIKNARNLNRTFFFRLMDSDEAMLIVITGSGTNAVEKRNDLAARVSNGHFLTFEAWQRRVRETRKEQPTLDQTLAADECGETDTQVDTSEPEAEPISRGAISEDLGQEVYQ